MDRSTLKLYILQFSDISSKRSGLKEGKVKKGQEVTSLPNASYLLQVISVVNYMNEESGRNELLQKNEA